MHVEIERARKSEKGSPREGVVYRVHNKNAFSASLHVRQSIERESKSRVTVCACVYIHICIHTYAYMHVCVCVCVCVCVHNNGVQRKMYTRLGNNMHACMHGSTACNYTSSLIEVLLYRLLGSSCARARTQAEML